MKHALILPTKYINSEIGKRTHFILALSHLLNDACDNEYADAIRERKRETGGEIILDNGLYENHEPESGRSLRSKAYIIGAKSVFAPDYLYDCKKTRSSLHQFLMLKKDIETEREVELPACNYVIQANSEEEYLDEFLNAQTYNIDLIGLSILSVPHCFKSATGTTDISVNRAHAIKKMNAELIKRGVGTRKPAHLLGLGASLVDIDVANQMDWCVSNDSSVPFWAGVHGSVYELGVLNKGKPEQKLDFEMTAEITEQQIKDINHNINTLYQTTQSNDNQSA